MPTDQLLTTLKGHNTAFERVDAAMQDFVDILRERDVSWAAIGEALGVSRQAAWKRFGWGGGAARLKGGGKGVAAGAGG